MLVLSRKLNEEIVIGDSITVRVLKIKGNTIRLGIDAPREVKVLRGELSAITEIELEMNSEPNSTTKETSADNQAMANVTVVFSNDNEGTSPRLNVVPFQSDANCSVPRDEFDSKPHSKSDDGSLTFRQQLPQPLRHNRLKAMVKEITRNR